jgi:hypothetical protein
MKIEQKQTKETKKQDDCRLKPAFPEGNFFVAFVAFC